MAGEQPAVLALIGASYCLFYLSSLFGEEKNRTIQGFKVATVGLGMLSLIAGITVGKSALGDANLIELSEWIVTAITVFGWMLFGIGGAVWVFGIFSDLMQKDKKKREEI